MGGLMHPDEFQQFEQNQFMNAQLAYDQKGVKSRKLKPTSSSHHLAPTKFSPTNQMPPSQLPSTSQNPTDFPAPPEEKYQQKGWVIFEYQTFLS